MNDNQKKVLLLLVVFTFMFIFMSASVAAKESIWKRTSDTLLNIAQLDFLDNDADKLAAFMRIMIWIVVFTVVWTALKRLGGGGAPGGPRLFAGGAAVALGIVLATISTIFISPEFLIGIGEAYSTVTAAVLVGFLIIGILAILYGVLPGVMPGGGRLLAFTRIAFILIILFILDMFSGFVSGKFN